MLTLFLTFILLLFAVPASAFTLRWTDNSNPPAASEDGFIIEVCQVTCTATTGTWTEAGRVAQNIVSYVTTVQGFYRVRAYNVVSTSGPSNIVAAFGPNAATNTAIGP